MLEKNERRGITWLFSFKKKVVAGSKLIIYDYIVHHPEHNSRIRSVSVQIGGIGKSYKNPGQTEYFGTLMPIMYIDH